MGNYENLKREIEAAAKRLNITVDVNAAAEAISTAFSRMLSSSFPNSGEDEALLREELLSQFYNVELGELVARFIVAETNFLVEARNYLFMAIQVKMRKMRIYNVDNDVLWDILVDISKRITTILPEISVLIG